MHRLTWSVDGAIGIQAGLGHLLLAIVILIAAVTIQSRRGFVGIRISKHLPTTVHHFLLENIFALRIGDAMVRFPIVITDALFDTQMSPGNGLSRRRIDHHIAYTLVRRLCLGDGIHIRYKIELSKNGRRRFRLEFYHIHTHRQTLKSQRILKEFIRLVLIESTFLLAHHLT